MSMFATWLISVEEIAATGTKDKKGLRLGERKLMWISFVYKMDE